MKRRTVLAMIREQKKKDHKRAQPLQSKYADKKKRMLNLDDLLADLDRHYNGDKHNDRS